MQVQLQTIFESLVNGQRAQMAYQIDEYGVCDFWSDFKEFLSDHVINTKLEYNYFSDAVISYFRIENR